MKKRNSIRRILMILLACVFLVCGGVVLTSWPAYSSSAEALC